MANGTIAFDTLSTSGQIDGTARSIDTDYLLNGSAKVWVHYNASQSITDSFNVTSVSDDATGKATLTIANDMINANYSSTGGGSNGDASATGTVVNPHTFATGSVKLNTFACSTSAFLSDRSNNCQALHGELA